MSSKFRIICKSFLFTIMVMLTWSCEQGDGYGESFFSKSYITDYVYPDSLVSHYVETVDDTMVVCLDFQATYRVGLLSYRHFADWERREQLFDSLMVSYGDTTYNEDIYLEGHQALATPIDSISVVSDADYDENHTAGSDLSDIVIFQGVSYYNFISHGYFREKDTFGDYYDDYGSKLKRRLSELRPEDYHLWKFYPFEFKFLKPSLSQVHHITVTIATGGKTFKVTETLDFGK